VKVVKDIKISGYQDTKTPEIKHSLVLIIFSEIELDKLPCSTVKAIPSVHHSSDKCTSGSI